MHELFDMIAGSETGGIIATMLSIKNDDQQTQHIQKNKYFAEDAVKFFEKNVNDLYKDYAFPVWGRILLIIIVICCLMCGFYACVKKIFNIEGISKDF